MRRQSRIGTRIGRSTSIFLAAAVLAGGFGSASAGDRGVPQKIKSATHQFTAGKIFVKPSLAQFEIVATDTRKITIALTGLAELVDTARFDDANGVLTLRDDSTQADYKIVSDRQNIIVGSGNVIINNIGSPSASPDPESKFTEEEIKTLPLTYRISAPRRLAVQFERAMGRIALDGISGEHRIDLAANGTLTARRLGGRLSLDASENTTATVDGATLDQLSISATGNSEVDFSGAAGQASVRVEGNAEAKFTGTADKADFTASGNASITARGDLKTVSRRKSGNAEIELR